MTIIKNLEKFENALILGTAEYLSGRTLLNDEDGWFHGAEGYKRAQFISAYLYTIKAEKNKDLPLLAIAYFIFHSSSSRLASLIGQHIFQGGQWGFADEVYSGVMGKKETSEVFNIAEYPSSSSLEHWRNLSFSPRLAVKNYLNAALAKNFSSHQNEIKESAKHLKRAFATWTAGTQVDVGLLPPIQNISVAALPELLPSCCWSMLPHFLKGKFAHAEQNPLLKHQTRPVV